MYVPTFFIRIDIIGMVCRTGRPSCSIRRLYVHTIKYALYKLIFRVVTYVWTNYGIQDCKVRQYILPLPSSRYLIDNATCNNNKCNGEQHYQPKQQIIETNINVENVKPHLICHLRTSILALLTSFTSSFIQSTVFFLQTMLYEAVLEKFLSNFREYKNLPRSQNFPPSTNDGPIIFLLQCLNQTLGGTTAVMLFDNSRTTEVTVLFNIFALLQTLCSY